MKITFIDHSGVMVDIGNKRLIFDYVKGKIGLPLDKEIIFFISHDHHDHFNPSLFSLEHPNCTFIYDQGIGQKGYYPVDVHQTYHIRDMVVHTLASNDKGVAFIVEVEGKRILFMGDLHKWDWPIEENDSELDTIKTNELVSLFNQEVKQIKAYEYDIIFSVVDFRLKENSLNGVKYLLKEVSFDYVMPIHFSNKFDLIQTIKSDLTQDELNKFLIPSQKSEEFDI